MRNAKNVLSVVALTATLSIIFPYVVHPVGDLIGETPAGRTWHKMEAEIQQLKDQLASESEPTTSAQANKLIQMMNRVIVLYGEGRRLFADARTVTGDEGRERQWYGHMARTCRMYGDAWRRKATELEATAARLKGQGK